MSKKEQKALEDAEFEAMMSGIATETKKEDKKVDSAPVVGDANAKTRRRRKRQKRRRRQKKRLRQRRKLRLQRLN